MKQIFVNLKRFDVPRRFGGVCPLENPKVWVEEILDKSIQYGLGTLKDSNVTYMLPEALIIPAVEKLSSYPEAERQTLHIGCQGVFRENVQVGGNFGAFTTNLPAAAAYNMGCTSAIIGHSEERKDKQGIIGSFEPEWNRDKDLRERAAKAVDDLINQEVLCAFKQGMDVLLCVGETAEERGEGTFEEQQQRIKKVLKAQLERGLKGIQEFLPQRQIVIGYEPIWAIGPGKTPPGKEYISFVSAYIKDVVRELYNFDIFVVYGGGLKEENAPMIASIDTLDGGLVALTRFTGDIGFEPEGLKKIIEIYIN